METATVWAMFYANLVAIDNHPGNKEPSSLKELAMTADAMLVHYKQRWRNTCPSSELSSPEESLSPET